MSRLNDETMKELTGETDEEYHKRIEELTSEVLRNKTGRLR